jgi:hypothetical protein
MHPTIMMHSEQLQEPFVSFVWIEIEILVKKNSPTISSIKSPILLSSIPGLSLAKGEKWE